MHFFRSNRNVKKLVLNVGFVGDTDALPTAMEAQAGATRR